MLPTKLRFLLICLAAAIATLGARWLMIERDGSPVPYLDQWFGEGVVLYRTAIAGQMSVDQLLMPHNGHRLVPSRLLALGLFELNGQWDVRLQMVVNAFLVAAVCFPLLALLRAWLHPALLTIAAGLLAWFFAQPILYENALWGFQSCFYFLILFSLLQIRLMLNRPAFSAAWWCGVGCGFAALVAMGSGLLASAIVAGFAMLRGWRDPSARRTSRFTAAAAAVIFLIGIWWLPSHGDSYLKGAVHPGSFARTFWHSLAFPGRDYSFVGLFIWLPFGALAASAFWRHVWNGTWLVVVATGSWVLLQIAAMGYAREHTGDVLSNRYYDVLTVGVVVNLGALAFLWHQQFLGRRHIIGRSVLVLVAGIWLAFVGREAAATAGVHRKHIEPMYRALREEQVELISAYLHSRDPRVITEADVGRLPFPNREDLLTFLRIPELHPVMPFELRTPIALDFSANGGPSLNNALPPSVPNERGKMHRGTFFGDLGAAATTQSVSAVAAKRENTDLRFKVAGDLRAGETELRVRDSHGATVAVITDVRSEALTPIHVRVPGSEFSVEVVDRSPDRWVVFVDPVEVGPLSRLTLAALHNGRTVSWLGVAGLVLAFGWSASSLVRRPKLVK